jgi:hypothetical protein
MKNVMSGILSLNVLFTGIAFGSNEVPFKVVECHSWKNQRKGFSLFKSQVDPRLWTIHYHFMSSVSGTPVRVYLPFENLKCEYNASGKEWISHFRCMDEKGVVLTFTPHLEYDETEEDFVLSRYQFIVRDETNLYVEEEDCWVQ